MNEELLQLIYSKFKTNASFEDFKKDFKSNDELQKLAYSKLKTNASFDEFIVDALKKKEDSTIQDTVLDSEEEGTITSSDLNEVESDRRENSSDLSDEQWYDRQNPMAKTFNFQKLKETKKNDYKNQIREQVSAVQKKTKKKVPLTEFGTFDYNNKEAIANYRKESNSAFMRQSQIFKKEILPKAEASIKEDFKAYIKQAKTKYNLNDPKLMTQENIDKFNKDVQDYY